MVGNFEFADIKIRGFADNHACFAPGWYSSRDALKGFGLQACPPDNRNRKDMVVYPVETGTMLKPPDVKA